ncbi:ankyrin repeat domain-containing protein [Nocardia sp. XZ_19_385]|uniref:ankyrin repeat domain-containing protein n=1 Tax=Nocardia sp. XZ_19_385 TaxID=2769488 RepID=UPI001E33650E|nr:ankyrin repeat domain-containing protein [Nocardia sp. XZ_19_385]
MNISRRRARPFHYGVALLTGALLVAGCTAGTDSTAAPVTTPDSTRAVGVPVGEVNGALLSAAAAGDADAVGAALTQGAQVDTRDSAGRTPLMNAVLDDNLAVARVLLEFGADPDAQDNRGESPWVNTGVTGSVAMMEALLPAQPDLSLRNRFGGNALIPAAEKGHFDYVREVLRQTDIDIDHVNDLGWTALLEAVYYGDGSTVYRDIVRTLVDNGADVSIRDADGHTAYDHAVRRGFSEIADVLQPG